MRAAISQIVAAVLVVLALILVFYAPMNTAAEDPKKPDRAELTSALERADREAYLLQWAEARRDISLLAAAMHANPDRFDAKTHALLDECGKLWVRMGYTYDRAANFFLDPQFPANDQQVAEFRAIVQQLADDGKTLSHTKLDELLRAASDAEWTQWEAEVDKEAAAATDKQKEPQQPKDDSGEKK